MSVIFRRRLWAKLLLVVGGCVEQLGGGGGGIVRTCMATRVEDVGNSS